MFLKLDKPLVNWSFPHRRGAAAAPGPAASRLAAAGLSRIVAESRTMGAVQRT